MSLDLLEIIERLALPALPDWREGPRLHRSPAWVNDRRRTRCRRGWRNRLRRRMLAAMTNAFVQSGLFGDLLCDREVAALFGADAFARRMLRFEAAWTTGLAELGVVSRAEGEAAHAAIAGWAVDLEALAEGSVRDGLPVPALAWALKAAAGAEGRAGVHAGATSQDVIDTAMCLTLKEAGAVMRDRLTVLCRALEALERAQGHRRMMGRTRMQAARPIPVSARIAAWRTPMQAHLHRLERLMADGLPLQYGGAVGLRDAPEGRATEMAAVLSRELGLPDPGRCWHSDRTPMLEAGHVAAAIAGSLGKMGRDVALMAQQGVDEIALAEGGGSSAMPHKRNPVLAETLEALARWTAAQQGVLGQTMLHEQERSGAAWTLEWLVLPGMVEATAAALRHAATLVERIERVGPPPDEVS